ncbi:hypothetical protein HETIRDRAFT_419186 [Heterobasidion irregulare TC 32-1]|uniref:Uncharacterized protein n=1 Tax=Heterobasidion irregulare (strain TC 32-1) TaxID=747525 RepID=W4K0X8_HETIT|nr:uncharacterized protein HETIRDRAFT_419186 [Heterobasidion irregulare TC 32-1]ETW79452.1 hypothetical protein HETIRDRAFT_419186 [Heterobasidion irregulare TC 32-1]
MDLPDVSAFHADAQSFAVDDTMQHIVAHQHELIQCAKTKWASVRLLPDHGMAGPWSIAIGSIHSPQPMMPAGGSYHQTALLANGPMYSYAQGGRRSHTTRHAMSHSPSTAQYRC